jgi:RHS repeat-associated protein
MRSQTVPVLALCLLLTSVSVGLAQNGPDNDPDTAPGYAASVFHHGQVDSINLYNGALTIPIALGPSYPIGPRFHFQLILTYNSRVWDFGNPGPDNQSDLGLYEPIKADPSLGVGWSLSAGAIKPCGVVQNSHCYMSPDGAEHLFDDQFTPGYYKPSDASALMLHFLGASSGYEMWDGAGNHYVFGWHVTGYDDPPQDYLNDLGYGRNGWYLTSVSDPFGNSFAVTYYTNLGTQPCWTPAHCPAATNSWLVKTVKRGATTLATVNLGIDPGAPGVGNLVTSVDFASAGGATARWTFSRSTVNVTRGQPNTASLDLPVITAIGLPVSVQYEFTWNTGGADSGYGGLIRTMTLPTGGVVSYVWGTYSFYHGRTAALGPNCTPLGPPNDADVKQSGRPASGVKTNGPDAALFPAPEISGNDCGPQNPNRWLDRVKGVVRRTERVNGVDAMTDYAQYAFPFGEQGSVGNNLGTQSLTLITRPADADAHRTSAATLFQGVPAGTPSGGGVPGGKVGADLRLAHYDNDPYPGYLSSFSQPLCGGTGDALCVTHAVRVASRTFAYDAFNRNRHLQAETTYYDNTNADGSCPGCAFHAVSYSNTGSNTWEGNGRHYNVETHSGNLGSDARTITTVWAPENWTAPPASGETVLADLVNQRTEAQGSSIVDRYSESDASTGFLKGSFIYDAVRDIAFLTCRYPDASGNNDKEFTKTFTSSSTPPRTYCSSNYPSFPGSVGLDSDAFGKIHTHQYGELQTARRVNGSTGTATFKVTDLTRDATTGWIMSSRDTAGLATSYAYDAIGRVLTIDPPGADLSTFVCYEGPNATTAYRASGQQTCPVAATNSAISTWEHFDYDGLGRTIRERRLLPAGAVSKRFTLYDGAGRAYFESEWVSDARSEAISRDLGTTCAFVSTPFATARPSAAPGTYRLCFDPFDRPQQTVGSKHSSLHTVDRTDGGSPYSDVSEKVKTYCVNATFANLAQATCNSGGLNPETTTRRDAFGRITRVTEPTNEDTTYAYDVSGKLTRVSQGPQTRTFAYDAAGFLRSETTPELQGTVTYDSIGSLGNVRQETRPGGVVVTRAFDFAGRPTTQTSGGATYSVLCYDGAATCADGSPGYAGGSFPAGKLTRRYGYNWVPTAGPAVDERFEYGDSAGRLSKQIVSVGNGDLAAIATQTWGYDGLGMPSSHNHPRTSGSFPVSFTYGQGLASTITGNGQPLVTLTTWNPASGLLSWKAGNSGTAITTTIAQDTSLLPRPGSISSAVWSSGAYSYDSAGNILKIGAGDVFGYDLRSRLTSATYSGVTRSFGYDRYGSLTRNGATTFTVDALSNRITSGGASYDSRGNLTGYGGETMAYDALSRQYRNSNGSSDWVYLYDGAGERVVKFPARFPVLRREMARYIAEANVLAKGWTLPACSGAFADVACSDPDAKQIQLVYNKGVSAGCSAHPLLYCPDSTLTRAQMAVFLVKGYKPDGFTPPACKGTFTDVTCSGPYAAFAPWIEQLYRDGVTAGCSASPLQFCPGNTVGEWEVLVWLAKAPGATPGSLFWAAYHPVPRGSIYTWRDEKNRVVTEASGGLTGASTAALSINRDNVFLGNLLVASYVASPLGWQYTVSDHLGSPRAVFNQSGQIVETHKFWPYGEDTNAAPPAQRLAYCLMERDAESTRHYDHARAHDYNLGRFTSPDTVGGSPRNPQSWNRYAYALSNPLKHIDPDGLLTIVVHGTQFGTRNADFTPAGRFFNYVAKTVGDRTVASFSWSGKDTHAARVDAAKGLASFVQSYKFAPGEALNIIAHSHGGNVAIAAINIGLGHKVDNLVTLGTPSTASYRLNGIAGVSNWVNVFNRFDKMQTHGAGADDSPLQSGAAARTQPLATNLELDEDFGAFGSHSWLHSPEAWDKVLPQLSLYPPSADQSVMWVLR